ncbi:MAG: hypothetical protein HYU64_02750 [Armatimonadetes bacterium]|nr:hypothetical protein [Armatimonadota bacterium]
MNEESSKIVFVGCVEAGFFCARRLVQTGIRPSSIVSIDDSKAGKHRVIGHRDLFDLDVSCERYMPDAYALNSDQDISFFRARSFDILVVLGWQRIIPKEIIDTLNICGLTIHGSVKGLPEGCGRSPMNWAIIEGSGEFHLSLLNLAPEADGGRIVGTRKFDILQSDNIRTLYYKNALAASYLFAEHLPVL